MAKKIDAKLKRQIIDVSKSVAAWVFVTAASFGYWLVVLLIASLVLLNVWRLHTKIFICTYDNNFGGLSRISD